MRLVFAILGVVGSLLPAAAQAGQVVSETQSEPYPGIRIVRRIEANPSNRIHVAYISLCTAGVHVTATAPATGFRTPGGWGSDEGVQLAVNGDFFKSGPQVYGDAVGSGLRWPLAQTGNGSPEGWFYRRYGFIAFGPDWVEFSHSERTKLNDAEKFGVSAGWRPSEVTDDIPEGTMALVSGFPELVIEGQTYTCSSPTADSCFPDRSDMRARHPRTAMGLTEDRKTFILVAVDGRDTSSVGMYGSELAALMADLGAWEAFNLDGGGSTAMWLAGTGYLNEPSDGAPRPVANHWGIFAGPDTGKPARPGSCFVAGGCFPTATPGAEGEPFADMPGNSVAYEEAIALLDAGIEGGCVEEPQRMFCPACELDRTHAATFLVGAAGIDTSAPPAQPTFDDVDPSSPAYAKIEAAVAAGILEGCSETSFCPDDPVTRGAFATMLRRAAGWEPASGTHFEDVPVEHAAYGDVASLADHCVAASCGAGIFCPDEAIDRAGAALMVAPAFGLVDGACAPDGTTGSAWGESGEDAPTSGVTTSTTGSSSASSWTPGGDAATAGCSCRTQTGGRFPFSLALLGLVWRRSRRQRIHTLAS